MVERTVVGLPLSESPQTELLDLRLYSAFNALREFKDRNVLDLLHLGELDATKAASLANELAISIFQSLKIEPNGQTPDQVKPEKIEQLTSATQSLGNKLIVIRHAEQSPPEWVFTIPRADLRKIRMMQNPFNRMDLITNKSLAEVFATGFILCYLSARTGKDIKIFSSENARAFEIARVIKQMAPNSTIVIDEGLTCITYKDEGDDPCVTVEQILADVPSGFMPWEPKLIDKLCKPTRNGQRPSKTIEDSISYLYNQKDDPTGNSLFIALTHSQQLSEVLNKAKELADPSTRLPEMSMIAIGCDNFLILERGVLGETEKPKPIKRKDMRKILEKLGEGYQWYKVRRSEYETEEKIPFLVSPEPLILTNEEASEILTIGQDIVAFMNACNELFNIDDRVANLLNRGKPDYLQKARRTNYLFIRPDLIITKDGFSICEIETSPFGLPLAELLNRAYEEVGFQTLVPSCILGQFLRDHTTNRGQIVYSQNTASYAGQLQFLAREILSSVQREWNAAHIDTLVGVSPIHLYRGFYLYEALNDLFIHDLVIRVLDDLNVTPSLTPYMEEKALLALIWDSRLEPFFIQRLGTSTVDRLRKTIPPTWIVGQEEYFAGQLPNGVTSSIDLADLSKSMRRYVLKKSGFGHGSSWGEGVNFLHEKSQAEASRLLSAASSDNSSLYIIQEFMEGQKRPLIYEEKGSRKPIPMEARIRITPYFAMIGESAGQMLAIKATGCENTNYIHASTGSINTAVSAHPI
ncbi:hypothetical protein A2W45_02335 [Candidatus Curtissbacteria bacterium RIFCSPHIGHO2_12_41_11]|uniref:Uncharacterized protein n=3 Tax=Candidatus Curtissiibacteriota TaxID=1752717 RepID=A0A1F5HR73_9BACT|nr:MAG: hypothetical protein UU56_C0014G0026 [Candidatus Curtissbacteria bacterium GW2011_GWA2_41_24]OGD99926.1 MAG: hypothetical protein A2W45_02335 [Candidatus Curtissbacteria bacterium RIFCSPHIGHO2_12_41_11]OGE06563.1 MAG: hypothetical protein A2W70_03825 [Candidatus Curtissbacteria bacterium RIFCSPLOWO2_02_41_11]